MRILFIWPRPPNLIFEEYDPNRSYLSKIMSKILSFPKPLTFPILAAVTPKEHTVEIMEGGPREIDYDEKYDIVGITFTTRYTLWAYEIADEFRKRGVYVVLGGWHASALPNEAIQHADSVVIGEAEDTWLQLLADFKTGKIKQFYYPEKPVSVEGMPHPLNIYPEGPILGVQATRGCPYGCEFCAITNMKFRNKFRMRPVNEVIDEIQSLPGKIFNFHDNSMTIKPDYTKKLFREMEGLGKKFYGFGNINILGKDEELLKLARNAGCVGWLIGFESISQESIDLIGKKTNIVEDYLSSVRKIHDYGMIILGSFVFGFDGDKPDVFKNTDDFVRKSEIDIPDAMILTPYPGTPLFDRLDREGRIITKDWDKYNFEHVVFKPKHMTAEELFDYTCRLYKKWQSWPPIVKRIVKSLRFGKNPFLETTMQSLYMRLLRYQDH
jgi:radical SAM superfamily enzyme YgiQ (UPF0313 family)